MTLLNRIRMLCPALFICLSLMHVAAGQDAPKSDQLELTDCELPQVNEKVRCGTYEVFEDRAARKGRKITLKVVVFPATGSTREPDPFVYIAGGPGSSATEDAPGIVRAFAAIRARRDMVFIDQRGTGVKSIKRKEFLLTMPERR